MTGRFQNLSFPLKSVIASPKINDGFGSNCDLQHRLALCLESGDKPTFNLERRQCACARVEGGGDQPGYLVRHQVLHITWNFRSLAVGHFVWKPL